jgi:microcystin-dependent protein
MSFNNSTYIESYSINGKGALVPKGSIILFPMVLGTDGGSIPSGFLRCDGSTVNIADYPDLYSVLGTSFGGSSTTFTLPNYQSKFLYGKANASSQMNQNTGNDTHTLSLSNLPSHNHSFNTLNHRHTGIMSESPNSARDPYNDDFNNSGGGGHGFQAGGRQQIGDSYGIGADSANAYISFGDSGQSSPTAISLLPEYMSMAFLIKY